MASVSIVMPVFNTAMYLSACLDSVISQSLPDFELICVDDCSTDHSMDLLRVFAARDPRIRILQTEKNAGAGAARNLGMTEAVGRYVIFCDADDVYPTNALKILHDAAASSGADCSVGNMAVMDADMACNIGLPPYMASMQIEGYAVDLPENIPALWMPYHHQRFMIKRDFLLENNIQYPRLLRGEDPPFIAQVLCFAKRIAVIPDIVYRYRIHGDYRINMDKKIDDHLFHVNLVMDTFKKHGLEKQAAMYAYFSGMEFVGFSFFRRFTRRQRKRILSHYLELFDAHAHETATAFKPFAMYPEHVKKSMQMSRKGLCGYALWWFCKNFSRFLTAR